MILQKLYEEFNFYFSVLNFDSNFFFLKNWYEMDEIEGNSNVYEIDRILKKRIKNGKVEYLLKWVGYNDAHNAWVSEDRIDSFELMLEFESHNRNEQSRKRRKNNQPQLRRDLKRRKTENDENNNAIDRKNETEKEDTTRLLAISVDDISFGESFSDGKLN